MNINESNFKTYVKDNNIIIELPIDLLKFSQENRDDKLKINNKEQMVNYIVNNILEWGGNADIGSTAFDDFIDAMFIDALEFGEYWLDADWDE